MDAPLRQADALRPRHGTGPQPQKYEKRLTGEHKDAVKTRADEAAKLFEKIEDLISCSLDEAELDRKAAEPCLRALFATVRDFDARFAARKRERRLLEFSDFEHLALRLLRDADGQPTELCQGIRQGYAAVMVDEYQDTNALQDALYRCLASPAGDDLFLVGDLKQSIYRFRQADPSIFREKLESWPLLPGGEARPRPEDGRPGENAMLALDANFRSAPQVVAGINFIFEQLMTPALGDTAYGDGQRLVCGAPGAYEGSVEAHFLPDDAAETDAQYIADRIEAMVASGEPVRDGGTTRPVQYEDCCVLLAARRLPGLRRGPDGPGHPGLRRRPGEPAGRAPHPPPHRPAAGHRQPRAGHLSRCRHAGADVRLYGRRPRPSPGRGADTRSAHPHQPLRRSSTGRPERAEDDCTRWVQAFYQRLTALRRMARSVPVEELLEEILFPPATSPPSVPWRTASAAGRTRGVSPPSAQGRARAASRPSSVLSTRPRWRAPPGRRLPRRARPGCVTIMTIHRSKGLQFPVVFVADMARQFNAADTRQPVLLHRVCGAGLRLRPEGGEGAYKTAAYTALSTVHAAEMRSEQMRLLYVALTRAQDKLILTVPLGIGRTSNPFAKAAAFLAAGAGRP